VIGNNHSCSQLNYHSVALSSKEPVSVR